MVGKKELEIGIREEIKRREYENKRKRNKKGE